MSVILKEEDLACRRLLVVDPPIFGMPWYLYPLPRGYVVSRATDEDCSYTTTKYRAIKSFRGTLASMTDGELICFAHRTESRVLDGYQPRHCVPTCVVEMPMSEVEYLTLRGLALVDGDGSEVVTINEL